MKIVSGKLIDICNFFNNSEILLCADLLKLAENLDEMNGFQENIND